MDRAQPTHPHPIQFFFFGNPSVTRPKHSNNTTDIIHTNTLIPNLLNPHTGNNITKLNLWTIFQLFFYPNETWTHPPTSNLFWIFGIFLTLQSPLERSGINYSRLHTSSTCSFDHPIHMIENARYTSRSLTNGE